MKNQLVLFNAVLFFLSVAFSGTPNLVSKFNLGADDAENECINEYANLDLRIKAFETAQSLPKNSFLYSVDKVARKKIGHRGSYWACEAKFESKIPNFAFASNDLLRHFGANRNFGCKLDREIALKDVSVLGIETNFDQGFIFNPYCQSFQLVIGRQN
jgi:hypothetical protein